MTQVAIVTGGEGGIGAAILRELNSAGYLVLSADICLGTDPPQTDRIKRIHLDLGQPDSIRRAVAYAAQWGDITALINCAGLIAECSATDMPDSRITHMFDINILGAARMTAAAAEKMNGGAVVNISSISARLPELSNAVFYGASKSALETYTRASARSLIARNIRVNAIAPGFIDVAMTEAMKTIAYSEDSPLRRVAVGRMGTPEEVAACVAFLVSERASYVVGATLVVDGGLAIN